MEKGAEEQAIGSSCAGRTTKIHAVVDTDRRLIALELTPGERRDIRPAADLIAPLPPARILVADAAYDSDAFRSFLTDRGTTSVIKQNPIPKCLLSLDEEAYKGRNIGERVFSRLKDCGRVAARYDKLARNFQAAILLVSLAIWWT